MDKIKLYINKHYKLYHLQETSIKYIYQQWLTPNLQTFTTDLTNIKDNKNCKWSNCKKEKFRTKKRNEDSYLRNSKCNTKKT